MATFKRLALTLLLLTTSVAAAAAELWQEIQSPQVRGSTLAQARGGASDLRRYRVDDIQLRAILQRVSRTGGPGAQQTIHLPMPDGSIAGFEIYESPVMHADLARKYPDIRTFKVYGIDDPLATGRLDITPLGFHAMLHTSQGRLLLDPHDIAATPDLYDARTRDDALAGHSCSLDEHDFSAHPLGTQPGRAVARSSDNLRRYRIAVAATGEYVEAIYNPVMAGGRRTQAQAEIVTAINRVNVIYERDLGVFLDLVAANDTLIDVDGIDGLSNETQTLFSQNQAWIDGQIGNAQYDIGHAFSTGNGGLGWLGGACDNANKARGVSGIFNPTGDPFYIDFVAHEIGHQFNAEHSFNGSTQSCRFARSAATAWEPGSGSTIMAYAGICGVENLQSNSDATFHAGSISQINRFIDGAGGCFTLIPATPPNPNHPQISSIANRVIPANTPFMLDAAASDADGDTLQYQWDQLDAGCPTDASNFGGDLGSNALFRSYEPMDASQRHFPQLGTQLRGFYDAAEVLPCQARDLDFRLTARDNVGGVATADTRLQVVETPDQFEVTTFETTGQTFNNTGPLTVEWNVAGTDSAPINCAQVDIELMTLAPLYAAYTLYPLAMATPNDGIESVNIVPATDSHPRARIRVKCSDNVFYALSKADFAISGSGPGNFDDTAFDVVFSNNLTVGTIAPQCLRNVSCAPPPATPFNPFDEGRGSSALDYRWLALLAGLVGLVHWLRRAGARRARARSVT